MVIYFVIALDRYPFTKIREIKIYKDQLKNF